MFLILVDILLIREYFKITRVIEDVIGMGHKMVTIIYVVSGVMGMCLFKDLIVGELDFTEIIENVVQVEPLFLIVVLNLVFVLYTFFAIIPFLAAMLGVAFYKYMRGSLG